jgi:hypothetical protein
MARRRSPEAITNDATALALHCQGVTYQEIATRLGWKSKSYAHSAVKRGIADRQKDAFQQVEEFALAVARIQAGMRACQQIIDTPHYAVTNSGKVATVWVAGEDGQSREVPVLDDGPKQRAITEMRHLNDVLIMIMDLKPASKQRIQVVTEDVVDAEIRKLADEVARAQGAKKVPAE